MSGESMNQTAHFENPCFPHKGQGHLKQLHMYRNLSKAGRSNNAVSTMMESMYSNMIPELQGGLDALYNRTYATVFAATLNEGLAKTYKWYIENEDTLRS